MKHATHFLYFILNLPRKAATANCMNCIVLVATATRAVIIKRVERKVRSLHITDAMNKIKNNPLNNIVKSFRITQLQTLLPEIAEDNII